MSIFSIFNDKNEIERLNVEKENYQSQLKEKNMENDVLKQQYEHQRNEMCDYISIAFLGFKDVVETAKRSDYGNPESKIEKILEQATKMKDYFAGLVIDMPLQTNRTIETNNRNK